MDSFIKLIHSFIHSFIHECCVCTDIRGEDGGNVGCKRLPSDVGTFVDLVVQGLIIVQFMRWGGHYSMLHHCSVIMNE